MDDCTCEQNILIDKNLEYIVKFLKEELNRINPIPNTIIVKSTRCYDAFNVPFQDFPLLKIYRQRSSYMPSNKRISSLQIQYGLVLPDQERLLPYLNWVDHNINRILSQSLWRINTFIVNSSKNCDYRVLLNELGIPVYSFLRFNLSITEGDC
jgi:hypothetical protein